MNTGETALSGVTAIELGANPAAAVCGMTLASLGAEVFRVELEAAGQADPSPLDEVTASYFNCGKKSAVIDYLGSDAPALVHAAATVDVVIDGEERGFLDAAGFPYSALSEKNPGLVMVSISPFGQDGPYRDYAASELVLQGMAGIVGTAGDPDKPPLSSPVPLAAYSTGLLAALAAVSALWERRTSGLGQQIDLSQQEALMQCLEHTIINYTHRRRVRGRGGSRHPDNHPMTIYECKDGYVSASIGFGQWELLCSLVERPDWLEDEALFMAPDRRARADELDEYLVPWFRARATRDVVELAQTMRLPFGYVLNVSELLDEPHLADRGYFRTVAQPGLGEVALPGPAFVMSRTPLSVNAAPERGRHTAELLSREADAVGATEERRPADGPLAGVRVLDFTHQWAGPLAGRLLADLGADVIKIESTQRPDSVRYAAFPDNEPGERPWNRGGYFHKNNRNKRGIAVDLSRAEGRELFLKLARTADIFINNYAPRVLTNLGLTHDQMAPINDRLISVCMPGYGLSGPYRDWVGFGTTIQGMAGLSSLTGYEGGPPMLLGVAFPDAVAGISAALAAVAALHARERTGAGQLVDLSQWEAAVRMLGGFIARYSLTGEVPERRGNSHPDFAPHGVFPCDGEDRWIAVSVTSEADWRAVAAELGLTGDKRFGDLSSRLRNSEELDAAISEWTRARSAEEAMMILQTALVPAGIVMTNEDLIGNPHLRSRQFFVTVDHADTGPHEYIGMPFRMLGTPLRVRRPAPSLGEHNLEICSELGLAAQAVKLEEMGIVGTAPPGANS